MTFITSNLLCSLLILFQEEGFRMDTRSYNLNDRVKAVEEVKGPAIFDANGMPEIDFSDLEVVTRSEKTFSENGLLSEIKYQDGRGYLNYRSIMRHSNEGFFSGSDEFNSQNLLQSKTEVLSASSEKLETLTLRAETEERLSKSENSYKNGLLDRQLRTYYGKQAYLFYSYKRDFRGNEVEIHEESEYNLQVFSQTFIVEYLEFDPKGNWTKRLVCSEYDDQDCTITLRRIKYYQ